MTLHPWRSLRDAWCSVWRADADTPWWEHAMLLGLAACAALVTAAAIATL